MSWLITPQQKLDPDAAIYIDRVEAADGQSLETGVKDAINDFVLGCKADGIWSAIKASCILAGARTLQGCLVPLVGTAPARQGTDGGWNYNRETGLAGNETNNYLNSNRAANTDPLQNAHCSVYVSTVQTNGTTAAILGAGSDSSGNNETIIESTSLNNPNRYVYRMRNDGTLNQPGRAQTTGLVGISRSASATYLARSAGFTDTVTQVEQGSNGFNFAIFAVNRGGTILGYTSARLAFYSIGESLDLALLDARVTDLVNAIGAAIP